MSVLFLYLRETTGHFWLSWLTGLQLSYLKPSRLNGKASFARGRCKILIILNLSSRNRCFLRSCPRFRPRKVPYRRKDSLVAGTPTRFYDILPFGSKTRTCFPFSGLIQPLHIPTPILWKFEKDLSLIQFSKSKSYSWYDCRQVIHICYYGAISKGRNFIGWQKTYEKSQNDR